MSTFKTVANYLFQNQPQELIFLRHGQSSRNQGLNGNLHFNTLDQMDLYGRDADPDVPLSNIGERQAEERAKYLVAHNLLPDVIIHSGYQRAEQTASIILDILPSFHHAHMEERTEFRERKIGYSEVTLTHEHKLHFPWSDKYHEHNGIYLAVPIGGESLISMREGRIRTGIRDLSDYRRKSVLVVCHGRVMMCAHMELQEMNLHSSRRFCQEKRNGPKNCSLSRYLYAPSSGKMICNHYARPLEHE